MFLFIYLFFVLARLVWFGLFSLPATRLRSALAKQLKLNKILI